MSVMNGSALCSFSDSLSSLNSAVSPVKVNPSNTRYPRGEQLIVVRVSVIGLSFVFLQTERLRMPLQEDLTAEPSTKTRTGRALCR